MRVRRPRIRACSNREQWKRATRGGMLTYGHNRPSSYGEKSQASHRLYRQTTKSITHEELSAAMISRPGMPLAINHSSAILGSARSRFVQIRSATALPANRSVAEVPCGRAGDLHAGQPQIIEGNPYQERETALRRLRTRNFTGPCFGNGSTCRETRSAQRRDDRRKLI
jgi:hypothetical protein